MEFKPNNPNEYDKADTLAHVIWEDVYTTKSPKDKERKEDD